MERLDYLTGLRAFEAAARNLSYVAAARELNVTPAAIGAQVRALELWLGVTLFRRSKSGSTRLMLTEPARSALPELQDGFASLAFAVRRLRRGDQPAVVTLAVSSAFATHWLLSRLEAFRSRYPGLNVRLAVSDQRVDYDRTGVDVGVRFGSGNWDGLNSTLFAEDSAFPVCNRSHFEELRESAAIAGLQHQTLIHDTTVPKAAGAPTWREWLDGNHARDVAIGRTLEVNATTSAIQAAVAGQGIALGRGLLVADDIAESRLFRPFDDMNWPLRWSWYLVWPATDPTPGGLALRNWLADASPSKIRHGSNRPP